ncbi:MAG: tryptophan 7-halogenase [Sphingomonas bacterium]
MTSPARLRDIVIVGGGIVGWMAAAALVRFTPTGTRITVVACPVEEPDVQSVLPAHKDFHSLLGVDEHDMLAASAGTMRLGTVFAGPAGRDYTHAFGDFGLDLDGVALYQIWLRARAAGLAPNLIGGPDDYSLAAVAGKMGRFARPSADNRLMMDNGYHLDTVGYGAFLKAHSMSQGVACAAGEVADTQRDGASGAIVSIALADGRTVTGDLFLDCSGAPALLAENLPGSSFDDWSALFPCDREVSLSASALVELPPLSAASAQPTGWHRRLALQQRTSHNLSFDAGGATEEAAIALLQSLAGAQTEGPCFTSRRMGRRQRAWRHNCVALGAAAGAIEPIEASEVDVARIGIVALISLIPDRCPMLAEADEFNRVMDQELAEQRDFALLHQVTIENDEPILRVAGAKSALPDSLAHRIALFRGRGRLLPHAGPWAPSDWLVVMLGRGIIPASWDPLADDIEPQRAQQNFVRLAGLLRQSAETMPRHADYIAHHCPAAKA